MVASIAQKRETRRLFTRWMTQQQWAQKDKVTKFGLPLKTMKKRVTTIAIVGYSFAAISPLPPWSSKGEQLPTLM